MLYFKFNSTDETIRQIDAWFDFNFKDEWLYDPMVIEMIKDVDRISEVNGHAIYSEAFGPLSPTELSEGVKALILMLFEPENEYWGRLVETTVLSGY